MIHSKIKVTWSSWSMFQSPLKHRSFLGMQNIFLLRWGFVSKRNANFYASSARELNFQSKTLGPQESQTSSLHCPICHLAPANEQRLRVFSERDTLLPPRLLRASKPQLHEKPEVFLCSLSSNWRRVFIWSLVTW